MLVYCIPHPIERDTLLTHKASVLPYSALCVRPSVPCSSSFSNATTYLCMCIRAWNEVILIEAACFTASIAGGSLCMASHNAISSFVCLHMKLVRHWLCRYLYMYVRVRGGRPHFVVASMCLLDHISIFVPFKVYIASQIGPTG